MNFEWLLDKVLGERKLIHKVECSVCEDFEAYYRDHFTKEAIGRACEFCGDILKIEQSVLPY